MLAEYLSFIVLLFALYVVAGGILVTGNLRGTPLVNTAILAFGTMIASVVGTTGAAMILVRPLIRANADRLNNVHVMVFFIFLVGQYRRRAVAARATRRCSSAFCTGSISSGRCSICGCETALVAGAGARDLRRDRSPALPQRPAGDDGRRDAAAGRSFG